jgi:Tfp pilus assembly protein PilO
MSGAARRRTFWLAALLAVANVAAYFAYTLPRSLQKRNVATRLTQLESELKEERARLTEVKTRAETIAANRKESRSFLEERVARPGASLAALLDEVEKLARKQGLKVGSQQFSRDPVKGLPLEKFAITMPVTGTYDQVAGLVQELEHSTYFMTLDEIGARRLGGEEGGDVDLRLLFSTYFRAGAEPPR